MLALAVTLTLKIVNQFFRMTHRLVTIIIIIINIFRAQFPEKKGLKGLHNLHPYKFTHTHTTILTKYLGGGGGVDIAPTINSKYMYNDENNTGKRKQNS